MVIPGSPPASDSLVAAIRSARIPPGSGCRGIRKATLGAEYAAQAELIHELTQSLSLPFMEKGRCDPASEDPPRPDTFGAAWYCVVYASPDWRNAPHPEPEQPKPLRLYEHRDVGAEEGRKHFAVAFALDEKGRLLPEWIECVPRVERSPH